MKSYSYFLLWLVLIEGTYAKVRENVIDIANEVFALNNVTSKYVILIESTKTFIFQFY